MPATDSATLGHGRMRAFVVACVGLATAVLVAACGGRSGLIPAANANTLIADLHNVAAAVFKQDCTATSTGIQQAEVDFNNLPPSVDAALVTQLQDGLITLAADAAKQSDHCRRAVGRDRRLSLYEPAWRHCRRQ